MSSTFAAFSKPGGGIVFNTVAEMRAALSLSAAMPYNLKGYYVPNDGGGGDFIYNPASLAVDDGGMVIKPDAVGVAAGAFERVVNGDAIQVAWFGATGDLANISVDVNASALTLTKRDFVSQAYAGTNGYNGLVNQHRYWGDNIAGSVSTATGTTNLFQIYGCSIEVNVGDVVEQLRDGEWVRIGVVYGFVSDGFRVSNDNGFNNDGVFYHSRIYQPDSLAFVQADIGQTLVVEKARLFAAYNTEPVGLNCKIISVDGSGVATFVNLDTGRGIPANTSTLFENGYAVANAVIFREGTDAIAAAIKYCEANLHDAPVLPAGVVGLMPFFSQAWINSPVFRVAYTQFKSPFWFNNNSGLRGIDASKSFLSLQYAVPNRVGDTSTFDSGDTWLFFCDLFYCVPVANEVCNKSFKDFTVLFPYDETVVQPYMMFRDCADSAFTTPKRHAQKIEVSNLQMLCPLRNVQVMYSNYGDTFDNVYTTCDGFPFRGLYDGGTSYDVNDIVVQNGVTLRKTADGFEVWNGKLTGSTEISFTNCYLESGGFEIKHVVTGDPNTYCGKSFSLVNTVMRGGAFTVHRQYTGQFIQVGADYKVVINEAGYSPFNFNRHYDYSIRDVYFTPIEIKKKFLATITNIEDDGNDFYVAIDTAFTDPSTSNGKLWAAIGDTEHELYINGGVAITNGNLYFTIPQANTGRTLAEMLYYVGKEIRLYSLIDYVMVSAFGNNRTVTVGPWSITGPGYGETHAFTTNCLGLSGLDLIINATFDDRGRGVTGHPFYNHTNIRTNLNNFKLYDSPNLIRISAEGSNMKGVFTAINSGIDVVKGKYAMSSGVAAYQPYFQANGEVSIDNMGYFKNDYGIYGQMKNTTIISPIVGSSEIDNFSLYGRLTAGILQIKDSDITFCRLYSGCTIIGDNITGSLLIKGGKAEIKKSRVEIQLNYEPDFADNEASILAATDIVCEDCTITNFSQISDLTETGRRSFKNNVQFIRSGVIPNDLNTIGPYAYYMDHIPGRKMYPLVIVYDAGFTHTPPMAYPVAVIPTAALAYPNALGRVLMLDATCDTFRLDATEVDDIRFSNRVPNLVYDYSTLAQQRYAYGIVITLIPEADGVIIKSTARINSFSDASRPVGVPIKLAYNKSNNRWDEVRFQTN